MTQSARLVDEAEQRRQEQRRHRRRNLAAMGLVVLLVGIPVLAPGAAAETPTAANVYAGDALVAEPDATGLSHRYYALRSANDQAGATHRAWDVAAGSSITLYFKTWTDGLTPPAGPNGDNTDSCGLLAYWESIPSANLIRVFSQVATCPPDATAYTFFCTSNGLTTGTPQAGTVQLRIKVIDDPGIAPTTVDTSNTVGAAKGAIRCGMAINSLAPSAYPAGSTFAYTLAGETYTATLTHTARAPAQSSGNLLFSVYDGATLVSSSTVSATAGSTTASDTITDTYPPAAIATREQVDVTGLSAFTGVKWTQFTSTTAPVTLDSGTRVSRNNFVNVDSRVTATHLLQVNDAAFGTPPMSKDAGSTRINTDRGYIATRFTNARGEGLTGASLAFTRTLQDHAHVLPPDSITGAAITTQGGQLGWGPLALWNSGSPTGKWDKAVDITAPASMDDDAHLVQATKTYILTGPPSTAAGDPLRITASPGVAYPGETVLFAISESNSDGSGRAGNAAGTRIDGYDPTNAQIVSSAAVVEVANGIYRYAYTVPSSPTLGTYLFLVRTTDAAVVASSTSFTIRATPTVYATPADVTAAQVGVNAHTDAKMDAAVGAVNAHTDAAANAARDLVRGDVAGLQANLGTPTDSNTASTLYGKLASFRVHADANQAATLAGVAALQLVADQDAAQLTQLLDALHHLNLTIAGNIVMDNATLQNITAQLLEMHVDVHELNDTITAHRHLSPEYTAAELQSSWLVILGSLAWLLWIIAAAVTRIPKRAIIRVIADLSLSAILALPMDTYLQGLLAVGNVGLLLYDLYSLMSGE